MGSCFCYYNVKCFCLRLYLFLSYLHLFFNVPVLYSTLCVYRTCTNSSSLILVSSNCPLCGSSWIFCIQSFRLQPDNNGRCEFPEVLVSYRYYQQNNGLIMFYYCCIL